MKNGRVPAAFFLRQHVHLGLELGVRRDRAGLGRHLAALQVGLFNAAQQDADVVAGLALVQRLLEHLDAGDDRSACRAEADDLDLVADLDHAALDPAGADRAAALDREHVLDRHQERLVDLADRLGDVGLQGLDQLQDRLAAWRPVGFARAGRRAADDRDLVAGELVLAQQFADFHLDQLQQFRVVDQVDLVQEDHEPGTLTWRASSTCSRVWGIGPSAAETTRIAPSIWAAPVIMFLT